MYLDSVELFEDDLFLLLGDVLLEDDLLLLLEGELLVLEDLPLDLKYRNALQFNIKRPKSSIFCLLLTNEKSQLLIIKSNSK